MDISRIDSNFQVTTNLGKDDIRFLDPRQAPFSLHGVYYEDGKYRRMPEHIAKTVSEGVASLHANCAGGRVRFVTDSPYIAISAQFGDIPYMSHFPLTGCRGFDLYRNGVHCKTFVPPYYATEGYDAIYETANPRMAEYVLNMPPYSEIKEFYIGLQAGCQLLPHPAYKLETPVVFYGSSITQGACCSRPGNTYCNILSRRLDFDYINLGFSGSARGEKEIADYIASLTMSAFVCDYDHNAPTAEHLAATHEPLVKAVRNAHPDIPILLLGKPRYTLTQDDKDRLAVITRTYENAVAAGDRNIYLFSGTELMALCGDDGTVDNVHPTDLGFLAMANAISPVLKQALHIN